MFLNRLRLPYSIPKSFALLLAFHVARHTFATLSLTYGADLYTICKLLGHSSIRITQIYADVISEKKRQAVNAIPSIGR
ncbi:MAG: tyrosine-type recombinase/integrase [Bacteroidaceae bacterium]|nr:tyrosine-type recombinase/integrase [Bacteroidaceae bacterium]